MGEKALSSWVILSKEGDVDSGHCTCKAGLGETCSHIAALLFFIEDYVTNERDKTVTDKLAYWTAPAKKKITCLPVSEIDFSVPKKLKIDTPMQCTSSAPLQTLDDQKFMESLRRLQSTCPDAAILKVVKPFCDQKPIPKYPPLLTSFAQSNFNLESLETLQEQAAVLQLTVTKEQATALEKDTRRQSKSVLWHKHRTGRVTASKFKAVCSTNLEKPSLSLINGICNPSSFKYTNKAMKWGIDNENNAKTVFVQHAKKNHVAFSVKEIGLIINPKFPHFGASPDALISCTCCGEGILEIKCPFSLKDATKNELLSKSTCLTMSNNVSQLKKDNAYYYQVQAQLFISEKKYCDFIIWSTQSYFVQRIYPDNDLWLSMKETATKFFRKVLLPEILGKAFTRLLPVS